MNYIVGTTFLKKENLSRADYYSIEYSIYGFSEKGGEQRLH